MDVVLVFRRDLLFEQRQTDGVDDQKEDLAAVQRRQGQQVHHRQVHGDERRQIGDILHRRTGAAGLLAHLGHGGHDAHRAAEIPQSRLAGDQHL